MNPSAPLVFRQQGLRITAVGSQQFLQELVLCEDSGPDQILTDTDVCWREGLLDWFGAWQAGQTAALPDLDWSIVSPFTASVLKKLLEIPYGQGWSYSDLANSLGKPTAVRAVASAVGRNPFLVLVPCHRVLAKNGDLGGFRAGLSLKRLLLQREGILFNA